MRSRGGVLLRFQGRLAFLPSEVARRVAALSARTPVPGLLPPAWGIALADGVVVTVLSLAGEGDPRPAPRQRWQAGEDWPVPGAHHAILCDLSGTLVAVTGGEVIATGVFEADDLGVLWRGEPVPVLDVRALYAEAEAAIWAARATSGGRGAPESEPPLSAECAVAPGGAS